jgi:hypothetical protein
LRGRHTRRVRVPRRFARASVLGYVANVEVEKAVVAFDPTKIRKQIDAKAAEHGSGGCALRKLLSRAERDPGSRVA